MTVEIGTGQAPATAAIVEDGPLGDELVATVPDQSGQGQHETMTDRRIPVVVLKRSDRRNR